jgi:hypothetical protein
VQTVKKDLLEQRKEDVKEIEMVRDAIAEFVEGRLQGTREEMNHVAQMVVVLTENCLIEQGTQMSLLTAHLTEPSELAVEQSFQESRPEARPDGKRTFSS